MRSLEPREGRPHGHPLTRTARPAASSRATRHTVVVPNSINMVNLLEVETSTSR